MCFSCLEINSRLRDEIFHQLHGDDRRTDDPGPGMNAEDRRDAGNFKFFDIEPCFQFVRKHFRFFRDKLPLTFMLMVGASIGCCLILAVTRFRGGWELVRC